MAWSWSHTQEAYQAVKNQLDRHAEQADNGNRESIMFLLVIWAEIKAATPRNDYGEPDLNLPRYYKMIRKGYKLATRPMSRICRHPQGFQFIADEIWDFASEQATCTNGGWEAWLCPFGCGCHMLPFTDPQEDEDEDDEEWSPAPAGCGTC